MRDLLEEYERLSAEGPVGRAVVTSVWGSAPRPEGATMLATADGRMAGSVSGGCVETAVVMAIQECLATGDRRLLEFSVTHERAWEVGLACGGTIRVFVEPEVRADVLEAARSRSDAAATSVIAGPLPLGRPPLSLDGVLEKAQSEALAAGESRTAQVPTADGEASVFIEVFPRRPTLLLIGAVHVAEALVRLAGPLGYHTVVADGREALLTRERFPEADQLILGWPDEAFRRVTVDAATSVCVLSHDPKFDDPALRLALRSPAAYVGAIGSGKTQAARRERLRAEGFGEAELAKLHGPIGLDLGGRSPAEIALAILAEITAVRHGRGGRADTE
ncbi:MAG TPA: XdhC/CoxI family protein [Gemmatimonadales bacterium]